MSPGRGSELDARLSRIRSPSDQSSWLLDLTEIDQLLIALAGALDARRWQDYAALYAADGIFDIDGLPPVKQPDLAAHVERAVGAFSATQHAVSNHRIEVAGDQATSRAAFLVTHVETENPADCYHLGGWYDGAYRRTTDGWRFVRLRPSIVWRDTSSRVPRVGPEGAAPHLSSRL